MKTVKIFRLRMLMGVFVLLFALPAAAKESDEFTMEEESGEEAQPPTLPTDSHAAYLLMGGILIAVCKFHGIALVDNNLSILP